MCLTIKKGTRLRTAKKDIVCYKVLLKWNDNYLISPYIHYPLWEIGKTQDDDRPWDIGTYSCLANGEKIIHKTVSMGGFHSYADTLSAKGIQYAVFFMGNDTVIAKCVIPKGTKYYIGIVTGSSKIGYCSKSLRVEEIIMDAKDFKELCV